MLGIRAWEVVVKNSGVGPLAEDVSSHPFLNSHCDSTWLCPFQGFFAFPLLARCAQGVFGWISLLDELLQGGGRRRALVRTHRNLQGHQHLECPKAATGPALNNKFCPPGRWPLSLLPNIPEGSPEWALLLPPERHSEQELRCSAHPELPGPANTPASLLFGSAANRASGKFPKPPAQSPNPWLCTPSPPCVTLPCPTCPARLPSPRQPSLFLGLLWES